MKKKSGSLTFFRVCDVFGISPFGRSGMKKKRLYIGDSINNMFQTWWIPGGGFFCRSVVQFLLRGSIGMEMKWSYGFTRRKECWLSLCGRERKVLLLAINGKFSNVTHERQLPQFLYFARQRNRRRRTPGGQSNCGVPFFSSKWVTKLSVGLGGNRKKKKNWPGGDDKFINMTIFGVHFFAWLWNQFWKAAMDGSRCGSARK